jgi:hypothetical protein
MEGYCSTGHGLQRAVEPTGEEEEEEEEEEKEEKEDEEEEGLQIVQNTLPKSTNIFMDVESVH